LYRLQGAGKGFQSPRGSLEQHSVVLEIGVRVKEMGNEADFTAALPSPLPTFHLGLFPTALKRKNGK